MPKYEMEVRNVNDTDSWKETYTCDGDAKEHAERLINYFNATLRPNQKPRELLGVQILDGEDNALMRHDWEKVNLHTIRHGGKLYDKYKCTRCGITGKRHGLHDTIMRDSKFKPKKYDMCRRF